MSIDYPDRISPQTKMGHGRKLGLDDIEMALSEYSDKVLTLDELRGELTRIGRPFAPGWKQVSAGLFVLMSRSEADIQTAASGKTEVVRKPPTSETPSLEALATSATRSLERVAVPA